MPCTGRILILFTFLGICTANNVSCVDASNAIGQWTIIFLIVPSIFNCISIVVIVLISLRVKCFKDITEEIASNTNWLARTARRVGFGPTAKRALLDYACQTPEINQYFRITALPPVGRRAVQAAVDTETLVDRR